MFCPRCATENKKEQRYCRQCGLPLPAVRLALDGQVDEAIQKYKKSETALGCGIVILLIGGVNAAINGFLGAWQSAIFSAAFGFLLSVIFLIAGMSRVGKANKLLKTTEKKVEPETPALNQSDYAAATLPPAPITEEIRQTPAPPPSVIENTTIKLKR